MTTPTVSAQVLRLGPFDFAAQAGVEIMYTSNVEGERPSESENEREDIVNTWSYAMRSVADFAPRTRVSLDAGIDYLRHYRRDDLDEETFGRFGAIFNSDFDPLLFNYGYTWEKTGERVDDAFVPTGFSRKKRQVVTTSEYFGGVELTLKYLILGTDYSFISERYDDEQFKPLDQDETTFRYYAEVRPFRNVGLRYEVEETDTDFVNRGETTSDETETITINFDEGLGLWDRPKVTYSIGLQREYEDGETEGWEWIHTLRVEDDWEITPVLTLSGYATYIYEQNPEDDDIAFQYGATLDHIITDTARQSLFASREPATTLGSNQDTDTREFGYALSIRDFLLRDVSFNFSTTYTIDDPVEGETEKTWNYLAGVSHTRPLTPKLSRVIRYNYEHEDSNLEDELLIIHEVAISLSYIF